MLTQEQLKESLHYDPETGVFTRLRTQAHNAGSGSTNAAGYTMISVLGTQQYAHRLAVLYMTGKWPEGQVDHRNGVRNDNRWANLRDSSALVNQQNLRAAQSNNQVGLLGVSHWPNRRGTKHYVAQLFANGRRVLCSYHHTPEEAHAAYLKAKREHHEGNTL